ncbi:MAG: hypothetical protein H6679_01250 [Epsilonproteobacteria bacterium]|nr:hypothetical protein [Campylobacterota bacterium]
MKIARSTLVLILLVLAVGDGLLLASESSLDSYESASGSEYSVSSDYDECSDSEEEYSEEEYDSEDDFYDCDDFGACIGANWVPVFYDTTDLYVRSAMRSRKRKPYKSRLPLHVSKGQELSKEQKEKLRAAELKALRMRARSLQIFELDVEECEELFDPLNNAEIKVIRPMTKVEQSLRINQNIALACSNKMGGYVIGKVISKTEFKTGLSLLHSMRKLMTDDELEVFKKGVKSFGRQEFAHIPFVELTIQMRKNI